MILLFIFAMTQEGPLQQTITIEQVREELALVQKSLDRIHPGYTRYTPMKAWAEVWNTFTEGLDARVSVTEHYRRLALALAKVRCEHTKAEMPKAIQDHRNAAGTHLPFRFRLFDERMYVVSAEEDALQRGDEVLAINDVAVPKIIKDLTPYIPVDGYTDHTKPRVMESDGDLMGSGFDQYAPLLYGWRDTFSVRFKRDGEERETTLKAVNFKQWRGLAWSDKPYRANFPDTIKHHMLDDRTAYLSVGTFVNYRKPVDPQEVLAPIFRNFNTAGAEHLILDLRENGGGSNDAMVGLASFLLRKPFKMLQSSQVKTIDVGDDLRAHLTTWDRNMLKPNPAYFDKLDNGYYAIKPEVDPVDLGEHQPHADHFRGKITVLCSDRNASGSARLIAFIAGIDHVRLVGQATGGSAEGTTAGVMFFLKLPHSGVVVRIPVKRAYNNIAVTREGMGAVPDVPVTLTPEAFFTNRDLVLEVARTTPWL